MSPHSKRKGKVGELELAAKLTELFGQNVRRGRQFSGLEGRDVVGLHGLHVECKRVEALRLWDSIDQAVADAADDDIPIVCHRASRRPWIAIVRLDDLPALAKLLNQLISKD